MKPSRTLPRWRFEDVKHWLHLHDWQPSYFGSMIGSCTHEVVFVSETEVSVRFPFECRKCGMFAVIAEMQPAAAYRDYIERLVS